MKQHTLASAINATLEFSTNARFSVWLQSTIEADDPEYEDSGEVYEGVLLPMGAGGMYQDRAMYNRPPSHVVFGHEVSTVPVGCVLMLDARKDEHHRWVETVSDFGARYLVLGIHAFSGVMEPWDHVQIDCALLDPAGGRDW